MAPSTRPSIPFVRKLPWALACLLAAVAGWAATSPAQASPLSIRDCLRIEYLLAQLEKGAAPTVASASQLRFEAAAGVPEADALQALARGRPQSSFFAYRDSLGANTLLVRELDERNRFTGRSFTYSIESQGDERVVRATLARQDPDFEKLRLHYHALSDALAPVLTGGDPSSLQGRYGLRGQEQLGIRPADAEAYYKRDPANLLRVIDLDRLRLSGEGSLNGHVNIDEGLAMEALERAEPGLAPVTRSTQSGADVRTGPPGSELHWSMKSLLDPALRLNDKEPLEVIGPPLIALASHNARCPISERVHLLVDLRHFPTELRGPMVKQIEDLRQKIALQYRSEVKVKYIYP